MKKYFNISVLLAAWLLALPTWAMEVSPDTLVDNTAQEVLAIVRQDKDIRAGNTATFRLYTYDPACDGQELVQGRA